MEVEYHIYLPTPEHYVDINGDTNLPSFPLERMMCYLRSDTVDKKIQDLYNER